MCCSAGLPPAKHTLAALATLLLLLTGCGRQSTGPVRLAVLPFENLTADPRIDWLANASAAALVSDLTGLRQIYPFRAESIRTAYATRAGRVIEANFEFYGDRLRLHASFEDLPRLRIVRQFSLEGPLRDGIVPLVNQLAKEIDAGARAFSTRDPAAFGSFGQALSASDASAQARLLQTATIQDPNFTTAYTDLGQTLLALGNRADAVKVAEAGAGHAPNPIDRAALAYLSAVARNDLGAREKALATLAQLTPADPDVFRNLAQTHLLEHKYAEAVRDYQAVARMDPEDPAIFNALGYAQAYAHDLAGARQSLTTYRKLSSKGDINAVDSLGEVHFYLGDFPAAERYFLEAQRLNPGAAGGIEMLKAAQARLMTGDRNGADQIFARYMTEYRKEQDAAQNEYQRAQWEFLTGRRKQALSRLQALLPSARGDTAVLLEAQLSIWNLQTGNRSEAARLALDASKKAVTPRAQSLSALCRFLSSDSISRSNNHLVDALALLLAGQFAEAIPLLENLYRDTPPEANGQVRTLLAWAYTKTGRTRDAAGLVDLYPIPLSTGEPMFASLMFPKFLQVRSMVLDAQGKREDAQKLMALYLQYAGDWPDRTASSSVAIKSKSRHLMRLLLLTVICCLLLPGQVLVPSDPPGTPGALPPASAPVRPSIKPEDKCSIEGTVRSAATGEALKKVNVVARSLDGNSYGASAISDAAGHYKIEGIDPGRYTLMSNRTGFVMQIYGAKGPNLPGATLTLTPGQNMKDVAFKLTPHGVVTGRVLDEDGDPMANVMLQCQRYMYRGGKKQLMPAGGANTNDLGEFRMFGLAPGKYYLSAQYRAFDFNPNLASAPKDHEEAYAPVYYPNSLTVDAAAPIEVAAGAQIRGIDLTLTKTRAVRIRGQVISSATNKAIRNSNVSLVPRDNSPMSMMNRNFARSFDQKGNFELHNVLPGAYYVIAQITEDNKPLMAKTSIDVGTSNIDDLRIVVSPMTEISGRVIVEDNADTKGAVFNVNLESKNPSPFGGAGGGPVKDDGAFTIRNLGPDAFTVNVFGFKDNFYLKAIRLGDNDVTDSGVDLTQGAAPGELTVIVSAAGGQVDGTVQNGKSEPAAGATVVLIPAAEKRSINRLYKTGSTDQNGSFSLKGIAPGEYKLFAWEQVEFGSYQDPDFLKPFESKGESVTIKENSRETKQLKLIPAEETGGRP